MNKAQRMGVFVAVAAVLAVVVLHSPWTGYEEPFHFDPDKKPSIFDYVRLEHEKTFSELSSAYPLHYWFGNVMHCLIALGVVGALLAAWLWAARDTKGA